MRRHSASAFASIAALLILIVIPPVLSGDTGELVKPIAAAPTEPAPAVQLSDAMAVALHRLQAVPGPDAAVHEAVKVHTAATTAATTTSTAATRVEVDALTVTQ